MHSQFTPAILAVSSGRETRKLLTIINVDEMYPPKMPRRGRKTAERLDQYRRHRPRRGSTPPVKIHRMIFFMTVVLYKILMTEIKIFYACSSTKTMSGA
ncbi:hypothetical protein EVAR_13458_1 [Eumeta japonica]|uniref:Uncharacterized protein n=1 Tax=Eumeta variegata TaxID=151549 RepID=A0A4C1UYJ7_EUMVA|nr:hypothetical protein EVAR_13458_1 [Eumeta japonica]